MTTEDAQMVPAPLGPVELMVRPARAWLVRRHDWPADRVEAVAGEVPPVWASIARPLYFVDDIDDCVDAERERCAQMLYAAHEKRKHVDNLAAFYARMIREARLI